MATPHRLRHHASARGDVKRALDATPDSLACAISPPFGESVLAELS
jgi:hypothetical protein